MPEIPEEAVQAGAEALSRALFSGLPEYGTWLENDEHLARAAVEAAAPVLAEHIAREIERVVVSGEFTRPRYERGGFLNDARWAAEVARETFTAGERPGGDAPVRPSEAPQSAQDPCAAPVYPPGPANPAETLSALREENNRLRAAIARTRALAEDWASLPPGTYARAGKRVLAVLDGPAEQTGGGALTHVQPTTEESS